MNPGVGEIFRTRQDRPWGPPSLLYNGYRFFPGDKKRPGRDADPSPPSSAVVMKEYSYISTPPMGHTACTEPQCLYKGDLYLYLIYLLYRSWKNTLISNFIKIRPVGTELFHADRRTDRHGEANSGFWQILRKSLKTATLNLR